MSLLILVFLIAALVLALLAAFNTPSRVQLLALSFAFYVLAVILEHGIGRLA